MRCSQPVQAHGPYQFHRCGSCPGFDAARAVCLDTICQGVRLGPGRHCSPGKLRNAESCFRVSVSESHSQQTGHVAGRALACLHCDTRKHARIHAHSHRDMQVTVSALTQADDRRNHTHTMTHTGTPAARDIRTHLETHARAIRATARAYPNYPTRKSALARARHAHTIARSQARATALSHIVTYRHGRRALRGGLHARARARARSHITRTHTLNLSFHVDRRSLAAVRLPLRPIVWSRFDSGSAGSSIQTKPAVLHGHGDEVPGHCCRPRPAILRPSLPHGPL